jgi:hypothetical protein
VRKFSQAIGQIREFPLEKKSIVGQARLSLEMMYSFPVSVGSDTTDR